jgi:hypothetical protein
MPYRALVSGRLALAFTLTFPLTFDVHLVFP